MEEYRDEMSHQTVAQLLFMSTISRRDIHTEFLLLTTIVKKPGEDNWGEINRTLKDLKGDK